MLLLMVDVVLNIIMQFVVITNVVVNMVTVPTPETYPELVSFIEGEGCPICVVGGNGFRYITPEKYNNLNNYAIDAPLHILGENYFMFCCDGVPDFDQGGKFT
eukprot:jgi/Orpsp1_1/1177500/evm.model.c7180000061678.1